MAEPAIVTQAQYDAASEILRRQAALPKEKRNYDRIRRALTAQRAYEAAAGESGLRVPADSSAAIQGGALAGDPSIQAPKPLNVPPPQVAGPGGEVPFDPTPLRALGPAFAQGAKQTATGAVDFLRRPFMAPEQQTALAAQRRQDQARVEVAQEEAARRLGVSPGAVRVARLAGSMAPEVAAGGAVGLLRGRGARIAGEAALGATATAAQTPMDENPTWAAAAGGLGSGTLGTILELPGMGADLLLREARRATRTPEFAAGRQVEAESGIGLTLAEKSRSPLLQRAEMVVPLEPGSPRDVLHRQRSEQARETFRQVTSKLNPKGLSTSTIIRTTKAAYDKMARDMGRLASENFRYNLRPAAEAVGATIDDQGRIIGGKRIIPTKSLAEEYRKQATVGFENGKLTQPQAEALYAEAERLEADGGLTLGAAQQLLEDLSAATAGSGNVIKDRLAARDFLDERFAKEAVLRDMEAAETAEGISGDAAKALRTAREQYRADIAALKDADVEAAYGTVQRALGNKPEEWGQALLRMDVPEFKELLNTLDLMEPGTANALRGQLFAETVARHYKATPGGTQGQRALDFNGLADELANTRVDKLQVLLDLPDAQTARKAQAGLEAIRRIAEGPQSQLSQKTVTQRLENLAINAFSLNLPFVARLVAGEAGPRLVEKIMFSPEGQRLLLTLGDPRVTRAAFVQALNSLGNMALRSDEELEQARQRAIDEATARQEAMGPSLATF